MQTHGLFQSGQLNRINAINEMQKSLVKAYVVSCFDDGSITDKGQDGVKAFAAMTMKCDVSEEIILELIKADLWETVLEIRKILLHPRPHEYCNLVVHNNSSAPPITSEATIHYVYQLIDEEVIKLKEKSQLTKQESKPIKSRFDDTKMITAKQLVACLQMNADKSHAKIYLEYMTHIKCYELSHNQLGIHYIKSTMIKHNEFKPESGQRSVYSIDRKQLRILNEAIRKDAFSFIGRMEISYEGVSTYYSDHNHSVKWAIRKIEEINFGVTPIITIPEKQRSSCVIM